MDLQTAIRTRRAYRSLQATKISDELIRQLAAGAQLAPSCYNKQPWRFVFVRSPAGREKINASLQAGNEWARAASLFIAVWSRSELDCQIKDGRDYYLFDTGLAVANLLLTATDAGLVAHPIAGYQPQQAKEAVGLPPEANLITLIVVGRKADVPSPTLAPWQAQAEAARPPRMKFEEFATII